MLSKNLRLAIAGIEGEINHTTMCTSHGNVNLYSWEIFFSHTLGEVYGGNHHPLQKLEKHGCASIVSVRKVENGELWVLGIPELTEFISGAERELEAIWDDNRSDPLLQNQLEAAKQLLHVLQVAKQEHTGKVLERADLDQREAARKLGRQKMLAIQEEQALEDQE